MIAKILKYVVYIFRIRMIHVVLSQIDFELFTALADFERQIYFFCNFSKFIKYYIKGYRLNG